MKIIIHDAATILTVEELFSNTFPYLRLSFFIPPFSTEHQIAAMMKQKVFGSLRRHDCAELVIIPEMSVRELEEEVMETYGLGIRLYRKSGKSWLETIFTEDWTLQKQNAEGEALNNTRLTQEEDDRLE